MNDARRGLILFIYNSQKKTPIFHFQQPEKDSYLLFSSAGPKSSIMTATAEFLAKAVLCGQGYITEPRLDVTLLVQAYLKSPALPGKQGGLSQPMHVRLCWFGYMQAFVAKKPALTSSA